jgi:chaperonin GroEL
VIRPSNYNQNQVIVAQGLRAASDQIRLMLGPLGRHILLEDEAGNPVEATDVRTFATLYRPEDPRDRLGASYATGIVEQAHRQAGDGAAVAVVLAQAMVEGATAALQAGAHPMALVGGVEAGIALAIEALEPLARAMTTKEQLSAYASMTAREDSLGELIAEAFDKVGRDGALIVEEANKFGLELEVTKGMRLDEGYISPHFITDPERKVCVLEDPYILLVNANISANRDLLPILNKVAQSGKPLLLIADDVEDEALATLVTNKLEISKSAAVKAPDFGDRRQAILEDIAILTDAKVIPAAKLAKANLGMLGQVRNAVVSQEETTLIGGAGQPKRIVARVHQIRAAIQSTHSDYDREKLQERLAKLAGGVAVIKIGAATEAELKVRKERCERAVRATRAGVAEGLLPGGGVSLRAVVGAVRAIAESDDRGAGVRIVAESLEAPYAQILANAGMSERASAGLGIDVLTGTQEDLFEVNIFDSVGVLRSALEAAEDAVIRFLKVA